MRAETRLRGVSIDTAPKLLLDGEDACAGFHDDHVRRFPGPLHDPV